MSDLKLSYVVESVVHLEDVGETHLLDLFARIKSGEIPHDVAPPGFVAAIDKLTADADATLILRTIVGEVTSEIIAHEIPRYYPPSEFGFNARIARVTYQETPEPLDPPIDVTPLVVLPGNRTKH